MIERLFRLSENETCRCSFLFVLFFSPLIVMIGGYPPITAPALTLIGAMMM